MSLSKGSMHSAGSAETSDNSIDLRSAQNADLRMTRKVTKQRHGRTRAPIIVSIFLRVSVPSVVKTTRPIAAVPRRASTWRMRSHVIANNRGAGVFRKTEPERSLPAHLPWIHVTPFHITPERTSPPSSSAPPRSKVPPHQLPPPETFRCSHRYPRSPRLSAKASQASRYCSYFASDPSSVVHNEMDFSPRISFSGMMYHASSRITYAAKKSNEPGG